MQFQAGRGDVPGTAKKSVTPSSTSREARCCPRVRSVSLPALPAPAAHWRFVWFPIKIHRRLCTRAKERLAGALSTTPHHTMVTVLNSFWGSFLLF